MQTFSNTGSSLGKSILIPSVRKLKHSRKARCLFTSYVYDMIHVTQVEMVSERFQPIWWELRRNNQGLAINPFDLDSYPYLLGAEMESGKESSQVEDDLFEEFREKWEFIIHLQFKMHIVAKYNRSIHPSDKQMDQYFGSLKEKDMRYV